MKTSVIEIAVFLLLVVFMVAMAPHAYKSDYGFGLAPHAAPNKAVTFVFRHVDQQRKLAVVHPVIAPDFLVALESGPTTLERGTILQCIPEERRTVVTNESGQKAQVGELLLTCGQQVFVVQIVDFDPR